MNKRYVAVNHEERIYRKWEEAGAFKPRLPDGSPPSRRGQTYTILMPPPNANASLHAGHGMYTIEDVLIRWQRMMGKAAVWIPGMDHAGFETQFVYEMSLAKEDKSRMDFDRQSLYQDIYDFVKKNSGLIYQQFKRLGFSADWSRSVFTLDKQVIDRVFNTFKKMAEEGLVYRSDYIVNFCVNCGTSLAELEVKHLERTDPLYFIKYGPVVVATVRPETMLGDTAVAVNPKDKRYQRLIGQRVRLPLTKREIPMVVDEMVDIEFGTGAVKVTPAHDPNDFEMGRKHGLSKIRVIDKDGKLRLPEDAVEAVKEMDGLEVKAARKKIVDILNKNKLIEKIDKNYSHRVGICYRCKHDLEPMITPNWFIKVDSLKPEVISAVKTNKVKFFPGRFKKQILDWMELMHDWPISRQIAWGIRIPAWYKVKDNPDLEVVFLDQEGKSIAGTIKDLGDSYSLEEIQSGLQGLIAPVGAKYVITQERPSSEYLQETDSFDTWFSSGQWPLVTLKEDEYKTRFPTDVMGTLADILRFWVSRMLMFSLYLRKGVPFRDVYLWSMVADAKGVKMSKSKGNVVDPIELVDKYGADAFRMSLVFGTAQGSKVVLSEDKVKAMRNFTNKIWNITRFIVRSSKDKPIKGVGTEIKNYSFANKNEVSSELTWCIGRMDERRDLAEKVTKLLKNYRFGQAAELIYNFIWHQFADIHLEAAKNMLNANSKYSPQIRGILLDEFCWLLKLLHPFMPFITEVVWQELYPIAKSSQISAYDSEMLITASWPSRK